jgi:hypothetical protein
MWLGYLLADVGIVVSLSAGIWDLSVPRKFQTASEIHPASSSWVKEGLSPGVRLPWLAAEHSTPTTAEVKNEWR